MDTKGYTAIAIARWISGRLELDNDFACEGLPPLDIKTLFRELASDIKFKNVASQFSIAISGQGVNAVDMEEIARKTKLKNIRAFTDDLHIAADWRNKRDAYPRAIVMVSGENAGVHTLNHYGRPSQTDLSRALLSDACDQFSARYPDSPEVHKQLLKTIMEDPELESLLSLESCSAFLARWDNLRKTKGNHAPWQALTAMGLLSDEKLFGANDLGKRLKLNLDTTQRIKILPSSFFHNLMNRSYRNKDKQKLIREAIGVVESYLNALQHGESTPLDLNQAILVIRPPQEEPAPIDDENDDNIVDEELLSGGTSFSKESSDALLDGREDDLKSISDSIDEAWNTRDQNGDTEVDIYVTLNNGQTVSEKICIAPDVLEWIGEFCNEENWGGYLETKETSLRAALAGAADQAPVFMTPGSVVAIDGERISLDSILKAWDEDIFKLIGASTNLLRTWREFKELRSKLLPHLGKLIYQARTWFDGRPQILKDVQRYLNLAASLYKETQEHYRVMESSSPDWARAALEALLSLDIIQVRTLQADGKHLSKAVLLPTHPLYLWRNERLSTLLRGLASSTAMSDEERETVWKELERPEQFLSLVRLSSLPDGFGLNQALPYTSMLEGLPVFENLSNTCSGADGAKTLRLALEKYITLNPNHPYPLRVAIVNPPKGEDLIMEIVGLLNDPRYRGGQKLSAVHLDLFATNQHRDRLHDVLRFQDTRKEDEIQEKVALGRIQFHLHEEISNTINLGLLVESLKRHPSHVAAIFDESTIRLRQRALGSILPMSPFCVRFDIQVDQRSGRIDLRPQPGDSPFSEFLLLMNELSGSQRDGTIQVYADAEELANTADLILQGDQPASRWLFLADRALPSEAGMKSVRIWERRDGLRDTFLATRDFGALARLLRPVFSRCNLTFSPHTMQNLLHQGARLLGSGLLDIIKKQDGQPDQKKVIGLAGLLFAARFFQKKYPGALVLSVDHPLARLWLRSGIRALDDRCDLLILWKNDSTSDYELIAAEVKASDEEELTNASNRVAHAVEQIGNTLGAVSDGLSAAGYGQSSPLSIPRCEMLKQVFVRAAQARSSDPSSDRGNRVRWGSWLTQIFGDKEDGLPKVKLTGSIVSVLLRRAAFGSEEQITSNTDYAMTHNILGEREISNLLGFDSKPMAHDDLSNQKEEAFSEFSKPQISVQDFQMKEAAVRKQPEESFENIIDQNRESAPDLDLPPGQPCRDEGWPPTLNEFGMIGQYEAVTRLVEQAKFSKNMKRPFSDRLLVGPAGVGKSTLARKIGNLLFDRDPLFFNGSDLRRQDFIDRLKKEKLIPLGSHKSPIMISPCLLFIDEAHGINNEILNILLSAMDDRRVTTIDGRLYDFKHVIILLATTDQGRLSEAFQSRPNKTWLPPYSLNEMAGIVWMHGKECLDKEELSKEACYEIAARNRCNPRRSVRELKDTLIPHFYNRAIQEGNKKPSLKDIATIMSSENIASFYEKQGIDYNGLDNLSSRFLTYLKEHGNSSENALRQALGLTHAKDFLEAAEYLVRLKLIETSSAGRRLTNLGHRYVKSSPPPDLRNRISRAI